MLGHILEVLLLMPKDQFHTDYIFCKNNKVNIGMCNKNGYNPHRIGTKITGKIYNFSA